MASGSDASMGQNPAGMESLEFRDYQAPDLRRSGNSGTLLGR